MKGVIFNLLEDVVTNAHGDAAWDALLESAGLDGAYSSLGSYDDAELFRLVGAGVTATATPAPDLLRWIGRQAIPLMAARWPEFFLAHASLESLLRSLNGVIHPEVHKLYPGARCPHFDYGNGEHGALLLGYHSPRRLCHLAHGFIDGAAAHYGQNAHVQHVRCMHRGDDACLLSVETG